MHYCDARREDGGMGGGGGLKLILNYFFTFLLTKCTGSHRCTHDCLDKLTYLHICIVLLWQNIHQICIFWGLLTRMVYLKHDIKERYTILVGNPRFVLSYRMWVTSVCIVWHTECYSHIYKDETDINSNDIENCGASFWSCFVCNLLTVLLADPQNTDISKHWHIYKSIHWSCATHDGRLICNRLCALWCKGTVLLLVLMQLKPHLLSFYFDMSIKQYINHVLHILGE